MKKTWSTNFLTRTLVQCIHHVLEIPLQNFQILNESHIYNQTFNEKINCQFQERSIFQIQFILDVVKYLKHFSDIIEM